MDMGKFLENAHCDLLLPNHTAIRKMVHDHKERADIPGVRVFKETKIVNR